MTVSDPYPARAINPTWSESIPGDSDLQIHVGTYVEDGAIMARYSSDIAVSDLTETPPDDAIEAWINGFALPFARINHDLFATMRGLEDGAMLDHRILARNGLGNLAVNFQAHRLRTEMYRDGEVALPDMIEEGFIHEDWCELQEGETDWELFQVSQAIGTNALLGAVEPMGSHIYGDDMIKENMDEVLEWLKSFDNLPFEISDNPTELFQGIRLMRDIEYRRQLRERDEISMITLEPNSIYPMRGVFHWMPEISTETVDSRYFANDIVVVQGDRHTDPDLFDSKFKFPDNKPDLEVRANRFS